MSWTVDQAAVLVYGVPGAFLILNGGGDDTHTHTTRACRMKGIS